MITEQERALLPCPFCGGRDVQLIDDLITFHCECMQCGSSGGLSSFRSRAIAAWNVRTPQDCALEPTKGEPT